MVRKLLSERPILVGGLGLAASFSLVGGLHELFADSTTLISLMAAGTGIWWWRHQRPTPAEPAAKPVTPVERTTVEAAIAALRPLLDTLATEASAATTDDSATAIAAFEEQRQQLIQALDRSHLKVALVGPSRSGKSALRPHLQPLVEAAGLILAEVTLSPAAAHPQVMASLQVQHDVVVYLVTEDLTESVLADLKTLATAGQRVVLGFNKQDNYLPEARQAILEQIQSRLQTLPHPVTSIAIATAPKPIKVRTYDSAGQATERMETPAPEITPVLERLTHWQEAETPHLVTQTVMRQVHQLRQDIQTQLNQVRRQQALPVVEQLQWAAAATAFASPVPSLDLLAAIAINGQLVMDLGRVYHQPLAPDQAQTIAAELAAVVVKLGIVEVSTQLLTTALKSHAATFVVGGSVQAFSAAYLTQLCGESLMAYFEARSLAGATENTFSVAAIGQKLQDLVPRTQRSEFLQTLINQGIQKLKSTPTAQLTPTSAPPVDLTESPVTTVVAHAETITTGEPA